MVSDVNLHPYILVQTSLTPAARGEERMLQLLRSLNGSLAHHVETRQRWGGGGASQTTWRLKCLKAPPPPGIFQSFMREKATTQRFST